MFRCRIPKSKLEYCLLRLYATKTRKLATNNVNTNYSTATTEDSISKQTKEKIIKKPIEDKKDRVFDESVILQFSPPVSTDPSNSSSPSSISNPASSLSSNSFLSSHPRIQQLAAFFSNFYNKITGFERVMELDTLAQGKKQTMEACDRKLAGKLLRYNELKQKIMNLEKEEDMWRNIAHKSEQKGVHSVEEDEKIDLLRNTKKPLKEERDLIAKSISEISEEMQSNTKDYLEYLHKRESALTLVLHRRNVFSAVIVLLGYGFAVLSYLWKQYRDKDLEKELKERLQVLQQKLDSVNEKQENVYTLSNTQWKQMMEQMSSLQAPQPFQGVTAVVEHESVLKHLQHALNAMLQFVIQQFRKIPQFVSTIPSKLKQFDPMVYTVLFVTIAFIVSSFIRRFK